MYGGAWRNGDKRTGTFLQGAFKYAQKGYVCITVNYRMLGEVPFNACIASDLKNCGAKDVTYIRIEGAGHGVFNQHAAKSLAAGSPEEITAYKRVFHSLDLDHDGKVTRTEYIEKGRYGSASIRTGIFRATGINADGRIGVIEYLVVLGDWTRRATHRSAASREKF